MLNISTWAGGSLAGFTGPIIILNISTWAGGLLAGFTGPIIMLNISTWAGGSLAGFTGPIICSSTSLFRVELDEVTNIYRIDIDRQKDRKINWINIDKLIDRNMDICMDKR